MTETAKGHAELEAEAAALKVARMTVREWIEETIKNPEGAREKLRSYLAEARIAAEAEVARLTHALETATTFSAEIKGALETRIEELTGEVARLKDENKELVAGLGWVDAWVSNPVGSYSVMALDGLFAMTRDRIRSLTATKGG